MCEIIERVLKSVHVTYDPKKFQIIIELLKIEKNTEDIIEILKK